MGDSGMGWRPNGNVLPDYVSWHMDGGVDFVCDGGGGNPGGNVARPGSRAPLVEVGFPGAVVL
jgi:hypothetical protein